MKYTCPICKTKFIKKEELLFHWNCNWKPWERFSIIKGYLLDEETKCSS